MISSSANGGDSGVRSGMQALSLLANSIDVAILHALAAGPKSQAELRRRVGSPAQTTLRSRLRKLTAAGAVESRRMDRFPGPIEHELTRAGAELTEVAEVLERWLTRSPSGPLELASRSGSAAVKALIEGWTTTMLRALAGRSLSLTELDRAVPEINYPAVERRLTALRQARLVAALQPGGRGARYVVTDWGRRAIAPIVAAAGWELRHLKEVPTVAEDDILTGLLMIVPLSRLPARLRGACRLGVGSADACEELTPIALTVERELVASCPEADGNAAAWAIGSSTAWLGALGRGDVGQIEIGGDSRLANSLIDGLHRALFGG